jgi:hypothetical protein
VGKVIPVCDDDHVVVVIVGVMVEVALSESLNNVTTSPTSPTIFIVVNGTVTSITPFNGPPIVEDPTKYA